MKITWPRQCFTCQVPLDIDIEFANGTEEKYFDEYVDFFPQPINLKINRSAKRRFNDGKFHPLCMWCFDNHRKLWFDPTMVRDREIGKIKIGPPHPRGVTVDDLATYAANARRYIDARHRRHGAGM